MNPEIRSILVDAFTKAQNNPDFVEKCQNMNLQLAYLPPEQFEVFLKENYEAVAKTLKETHLLD
ncbi:MAG: hypothetical protein Pg6C_03090 [Treponemataceae bacterium]|nr:MAG: hypothetical protein Pg6C_03090 [Treponemataceae bacterium]